MPVRAVTVRPPLWSASTQVTVHKQLVARLLATTRQLEDDLEVSLRRGEGRQFARSARGWGRTVWTTPGPLAAANTTPSPLAVRRR